MRLRNPDQYIGYLLADVTRLIRTRFGERAKQIRFSRSQWQVLAWLRRNEGISQAGLAKLLEVSPMTLVHLIDKLEADGFVVRRRTPNDRRVHQLFLAPGARPQLDKLWEIAAETRNEALIGIPRMDIQQVVKTLMKMRQNLAPDRRQAIAKINGKDENEDENSAM
jgi:MarR family transcriptional regulator, transcriptional regulator for hemolysin